MTGWTIGNNWVQPIILDFKHYGAYAVPTCAGAKLPATSGLVLSTVQSPSVAL